jgi:drug/metabolite transporter (DMT)-like permease
VPARAAAARYLGIGSTAIGFATWAFALRRMPAGRLGSLMFLVPVVAILLGWALLGETPPCLAALGGGLCIARVVLARRRYSGAAASSSSTATASR